MEFKHTSVLLEETIENLDIKPQGVYLDGTLGGGGHACEVCKRLDDKGRLYGIDQDGAAIEAAGKRLGEFGQKVTIIRDNYCNAKEALREKGVEYVDGIVLDLGVSSYQLDTVERGFTYKYDTPLDMRMDQRGERTAADIVNTCSEAELSRILWEYGEERYAKRIAKNLVEARKIKPIKTAGELVDVIRASIPMKLQASGGHPAKRTFQALRIELNQELFVLEHSIDGMIDRLKPGGRLCIITFHSLEDRIVKNRFRENENPCICPPGFPVCVCGRVSKGRVVTRKPIIPAPEEIAGNKRSKSSKLRVFERT